MNWIMMVVAAVAALVTLVIGGQAMAKYSTLRFPWIIATAAAVLVFVSLLTLGEQWMQTILLPYAALGLALLALFVFLAFRRGMGGNSGEDRRRRDGE